jgi:hypothetical protein
MKTLKLLFAFFSFVLTTSLFAQNSVYTTNTSSPNACDGSACLDSMVLVNTSNTSIYWSGAGTVIQQGGSCVYNLCPGTYTVTYTINGQNVTSTFVINSGSGNPCNSLYAVLNTTAATDPTTCDATSSVTATGGTAPYTFSWNLGNGTTTNTSTATNLCSDTYICCYVADANGCVYTACDSVFAQNGNNSGAGDTLIINGNVGGCNTPVGSVVMSVEDCNFDFNAVSNAYLSAVIPGANALDSSTLLWVFVDTNGVSTTISTYAPAFGSNGCYNVTLILFCSAKSSNIKTIIVNSTYTNQSVGIEMIQTTAKKVIKVMDLTGREIKNENINGIVLYQFEDGTIQKFYQTKGN